MSGSMSRLKWKGTMTGRMHGGLSVMLARVQRSDPVATLGRLLQRMEATVPFPMDIAEFHASLYPADFVAAVRSNWATSANVRGTVGRGSHVLVDIGADRYIRLVSSEGLTAVVNHDGIGALQCYSHPHMNEIEAWFVDATRLDARLTYAFEKMSDVLVEDEALAAWPELAHAVGIRKLRKPRPQRLSKLIHANDRKEFDDLLARASLLPEPSSPHAWIGLINPREAP